MTLLEFIYLIVSVLGIFSTVIVITKIFGLRTFAKMSSFDFASTIAIGSVLTSIILNTDYSLLKGAITLVAIVGFQTLFSFLVRRSKSFKQLFTNKPQIVLWKGKILDHKLKQCNVGKNDLYAKLREANVSKLSEVKAVVFENTGDVSVLYNKEDEEIDACIFTDVDMDDIG